MLLTAVSLCCVQTAAAQSRDDVTDEVDILALALFDTIQPWSIRENVEYCGYIGYDRSGQLTATKAARGDMVSCEIPVEPEGFRVIASYHTHAGYDPSMDSEVPSIDDLKSDFDERINGYIATPGGRVWLFILDENAAHQLCGISCIQADAKFRPCHAYLPAERYDVKGLDSRSRNDPGRC